MKKVFVLLAVLTAAVNVNAGDYEPKKPDFIDNGIGYDITSNSTCKVAMYRDANSNSVYSGDFVIPSTANYGTVTYTVTCIGKNAFSRSTITSIQIAETVTEIEDDAFDYCEKLTSIDIGKNIVQIGDRGSWRVREVFEDCYSLTAFNVDPDNPNYADIDGVLTTKDKKALFCYPCAKQGSSYTTPAEVEIIGPYAFMQANNLVDLILSNHVTSIQMPSFYECNNLQTITIGDGVTDIGYYENFVENCPNLKTIYIGANLPLDYVLAIINESKYRGYSVDASKNKYVTVSGNVLFSKDMTELYTVMAPISGAYTIPLTVTSIGGGAFYGCENLLSVTFPNSVTNIGNYAFSNCRGLTSVTIPNSVASIGQGAFYGCI